MRCLPRTPGSGTKLIYAQLKPSKHYAADQIKVSVTTAFNVLPRLSFSGPPLLSGKIRGQKQPALERRGVSVSVPCKAGGWLKRKPRVCI